jgi:hypothetical protein
MKLDVGCHCRWPIALACTCPPDLERTPNCVELCLRPGACRKISSLRLKDRSHGKQLPDAMGIHRRPNAEGLRQWIFREKRPTTLFDADRAGGLERLHRFAHHGSADAEHVGDLGFGGQTCAWGQLVGPNNVEQLPDHKVAPPRIQRF